MKLCIECVYFKPALDLDGGPDFENGWCLGNEQSRSPVTGAIKYPLAKNERENLANCGVAGVHWRPRNGGVA